MNPLPCLPLSKAARAQFIRFIAYPEASAFYLLKAQVFFKSKYICTNTEIADAGAIPPALPPSVEEAYRRKCIELKHRMNEVEESNDATRIRIGRMKRSIMKLRLERAFLLEQLARRTSTNGEDSQGSPSPPPTVCHAAVIHVVI